MEFNILYEDENVLAIDKPAGIVVFPENNFDEKTLIDYLIEEFPDLKNAGTAPRYGIVHRLDKDTSGILLVAKNDQAMEFLQKQFKEREAEKRYTALVTGDIKQESGKIETLIGRSPKNRQKQKVYLPQEPSALGKRTAITEYRILKRLNNYTLVEVIPKTGRKHQIRIHLSYLGHPLACDKIYGFKNQPCPKGLKRQFLHAGYLKIKLPGGQIKEFKSNLPEDLENIIKTLSQKL
ncbi:MAG: RluA family pseudouridine synthase [Patescibacteria group bacterium]